VFYGCTKLTGTLTLPSNLISIGALAFRGCPFTTLRINSNTLKLDDTSTFGFFPPDGGEINSTNSLNLFYKNQLCSVSNLPPIGYSYVYYNYGNIYDPNLFVITGNDQQAPEGTIAIVFAPKNNCTSLPEFFTINCKRTLRKIDFTNASSLQTIGLAAFQDCSALTGSIDLSSCTNLITISAYSFENCYNSLSLNISGCTKLTSIGFAAFDGCSALTGSVDLSGCTLLEEININAFQGCSSLTSINLSGCTKLQFIRNDAFHGCSRLTGSVDLSTCTLLEGIFGNAFSGCTSLTGTLSLPSSLIYIGYSAFENCPFTKLEINSKILLDTPKSFGFNQTNGLSLYYQ
jgi:hypothetical protein